MNTLEMWEKMKTNIYVIFKWLLQCDNQDGTNLKLWFVRKLGIKNSYSHICLFFNENIFIQVLNEMAAQNVKTK